VMLPAFKTNWTVLYSREANATSGLDSESEEPTTGSPRS
jgi:hypothetical protein